MDIRVSGHQLATGEALQTHVTDRMNAIADKYFARAISAHATFGRGPHDSVTSDIVAHVMQGVVLKGHHQAQDAHVAFEGAADKIEKQLRRYMRRLQDRHSQSAFALKEEEAAYTVFDGGDFDADMTPPEAPVIVAEMRVDIPESTVSDAVMRMDLADQPVMMFRNSATGELNVVYRRSDGHIGLKFQ